MRLSYKHSVGHKVRGQILKWQRADMFTDQTIVNEWKSDASDDSGKDDGPLTFRVLRQ